MAGKFNLTQLLNQRSLEVQTAAVEEEAQAAGEEKQSSESLEAVMLDAYDLIPSKDNFYHVDDELKHSIELVGVLQPLLVKRDAGGKYSVIAGHRRRLASIALVEEGKEEYRQIPCVIKKESVLDRLALIMANRFRDKTDWEKMNEAIEAEELATQLKEEHKLPGRTRDLLSEITGVSTAQLGRYKAIHNNLNPLLMAEFKENNIGFSVVSEICGMPEDYQKQAAEIFMENEILTLADIKELKKQQEEQPEQDFEPQPDTVTSLCYSCTHYEECHEKKSTVTSCNTYENRKEAKKTDEQRYNEEQAAIDRDTKRKLQEQEQEAKTQQLPSEEEPKQHDVRIATGKYDEITSGQLTFLLLKKDGYKLGEEVELPEYTNGVATGRKADIQIIYIWQDWSGLDDDYCIIGFNVTAYDA